MKTIQIDAQEIHRFEHAQQALASWFDLDPTLTLSQIQRELQSRQEYVMVEVLNWPVDGPEWQQAGFILEAVQQHSSFFFLIWGTQNDMVNPDAKTINEELVPVVKLPDEKPFVADQDEEPREIPSAARQIAMQEEAIEVLKDVSEKQTEKANE